MPWGHTVRVKFRLRPMSRTPRPRRLLIVKKIIGITSKVIHPKIYMVFLSKLRNFPRYH